MKSKILVITWGLILVALTSLAVYQRISPHSFDPFTRAGWVVICAVVSAAFFVTYFVRGTRHWVWLFPALGFASLAITLGGVISYSHGPISPVPFIFSLAIPLYVGFALDHTRWEYLLLAWAVTVLPVIPPLTTVIDDDILVSLALITLAIPFLVGYLVGKHSSLLLFITASLGFTGVFSLLEPILHGDVLGPVILILLALPFCLTYLASRTQWWALIPAGIFITTGFVALLGILLPGYEYLLVSGNQVGVYICLLSLGFAATFLAIWSLHSRLRTGWAIYPALGFLAASILAFIMGPNFMEFLPLIALLVVGLIMLPAMFLKMKVSHQPSS